jgi:hypothetical protein
LYQKVAELGTAAGWRDPEVNAFDLAMALRESGKTPKP